MIRFLFFILLICTLPLKASINEGDNLCFDIYYSGMSLGYLQIDKKASFPLEQFIIEGAGNIYGSYFSNILELYSSANCKVLWLKVKSNVAQLDKVEDIYLLVPKGYPLLFKQVSQAGVNTTTIINPISNQIVLLMQDGTKEVRQYSSPVFDPVSLLYYLRWQDFTKSLSLATIDQSFVFDKVGEQVLSYRGKNYGTIVIKSTPAKITFWFSNDARRLPLKIQYDMFMGSVIFELRT